MAILAAATLICVSQRAVADSRTEDNRSPIDMRAVAADLRVPPITEAAPAAGLRVRQVTPQWQGTEVYHALYLPFEWKPEGRYPLIVEYTGNGPYRNKFGDVSSGRVEDAELGYGISGGREFIWINLPFLNGTGTANVTRWWGEPPQHHAGPTVEYCKKTVPWICQTYGGDPEKVLLVGFSRGAIACNYIGLFDDEIARIWTAIIAYSHYDGVLESWPYPDSDRAAAQRRLRRLAGRPQLICSEQTDGDGGTLSATRAYLRSTGVEGDFTYLSTGFRNHDDAWILRPSPARDRLRCWVQRVLKPRPP